MSEPLTGVDEQVFYRLRITEQILKRARIVRVTTQQAAEEFGVNLDGDSGVAFPYFPAPIGRTPRRLTARVRRDHPTKEQKYASPFGDVRHLYFAPCSPVWIDDRATPVILTEAEKSALAILRFAEEHNFPIVPIALGGCWNWRGRIGKKLTPEGERTDERGPLPDLEICRARRCYVLYDNDVSKNNSVFAAREKLIETLLFMGADVRVMDLPIVSGVSGPDDFLGRRGDAEFFELFESVTRRTATKVAEELRMTAITQIQSQDLEWLWDDRLPAKYIGILSGDPDTGKTSIICDIIARYTTGREWPDGTANKTEPRHVLMMVTEDGLADVIKPRLVAAGADLSKVFVLNSGLMGNANRKERLLALDEDLDRLEQTLRVHPEFGLVIFDPLSNYLGKADMNKEQQVRAVLGPITGMCQRTRVTVLGLGHFNKRSDVSALHKVGGAVANTGIPRAVWLTLSDPRGEKGDMLLLLGKGNLTKRRTGLRYRFVEREVMCDNGKTTGVPIIQWLGEAADDAQSVAETLRNPEEKAEERAEAFLRKFLADDEKPSNEIIDAAEKAGVKERTLWRAKKNLHIKVRQHAGSWWWQPLKP